MEEAFKRTKLRYENLRMVVEVWGNTGSCRNHITHSGRWLTRVMSRQLLLHVVCIYYQLEIRSKKAPFTFSLIPKQSNVADWGYSPPCFVEWVVSFMILPSLFNLSKKTVKCRWISRSDNFYHLLAVVRSVYPCMSLLIEWWCYKFAVRVCGVCLYNI